MTAIGIFFSSLLASYTLGSFWESLFHQHILDVIPRSRASRWRGHKLLSELWFACYSHNVVHHYQTFRSDHTVQFRFAQEEEALRAVLVRHLGEADAAEIVKSGYGVSFTWGSARYFGLPLLASMLWLIALPNLMILSAGLAGSIGGLPYFILSKAVHPWLHRPYAVVAEAPWAMRVFLRSRYGMAIRIGHFVHHRRPICNYNLMLLADLLRGRWRPASEAEWADMVRIGLVESRHQAALQGRHVLLHPL